MIITRISTYAYASGFVAFLVWRDDYSSRACTGGRTQEAWLADALSFLNGFFSAPMQYLSGYLIGIYYISKEAYLSSPVEFISMKLYFLGLRIGTSFRSDPGRLCDIENMIFLWLGRSLFVFLLLFIATKIVRSDANIYVRWMVVVILLIPAICLATLNRRIL